MKLRNRLLSNQSATIYVCDHTKKIFAELPDGSTLEFYNERIK